MTDNPFLFAILARPADDMPRLAYADWLDERGDTALAEFVRLQCKLAALGPHATRDVDPERTAAERRERDLWTVVGDWYKADLPAGWTVATEQGRHRREHTGRYAFVTRGFVSVVSCPLSSWITFGPTLVRQHPVERVVPYNHMPAYVWQDDGDDGNGEWTVWLLGGPDERAEWGEVYEEHYPGLNTTNNQQYLRTYQSDNLLAWARAHPGRVKV